MGGEKILILEIDKKIKEKLKELHLKPEVSPKKFLQKYKTGKHRYFSPCFKKEKEVVAFYARLHDNLDAKQKFLNEVRFLKELKKSNLRIKEIVPEILSSGVEKDFEWFEREYPPPPPLGKSRKASSPLSPLIIDKIVKAIVEISRINPKKFPKIKFKKFNPRNYLAEGTYENLVKRRIISREISHKIARMIKNKMGLLEKENHYFSHGDLNLGNILSNGENIRIIDWELVHLNNFAYDIGYLWAHLWEAKRDLRNRLMASYLKRLSPSQLTKFKKLLPVVASYLSLGGIKYKKRREKIKILEKRRVFYLKLLKNCLDFKRLIKV
ncbi:MAG: phosphotransferase [Candidatus Paceibacterales bacterium]